MNKTYREGDSIGVNYKHQITQNIISHERFFILNKNVVMKFKLIKIHSDH